MTPPKETQDSVSELIESAFGDEPAPKEYPITALEEKYADYEGATVRRYFMGKRWKSLSFSDARCNLGSPIDAALGFMPDAIALYYLPFFMKVSLLGRAISDTAFDSAISFVTPGHRFAYPDGWGIFTSMSLDKRKAIAIWLKYLIDSEELDDPSDLYRHPAVKAFNKYWRKYAQPLV